jgi:hypothetical protein
MPEMPFGQLLDFLRIDAAMLPPSLFLFLPDCSVLSNGSDKRLFVMKEDIRLRCANAGVYLW